jgi:methyl-accepting chemotaxis protein
MVDVQEGDFSVRADVTTKDEIGHMADTFNGMLVNVNNLINQSKEASQLVNEAANNLAINAEQASESAKEVNLTVNDIAIGAGSQAEDAERGAVITSELNEEIELLLTYIDEMKDRAAEVHNQNEISSVTVAQLNERTNENANATSQIGSSVDI